jgi:hypothetical protein
MGVLFGLVGAMLASLSVSSASGRPQVDDLSLDVFLTSGNLMSKTNGLRFQLAFEVSSSSGVPHEFTLTTSLPAGLSWGTDGPDPSEGCSGTAPAVCTQTTSANPAGTVGGGWQWDVVASAAGFYEVTASVESPEPDPDLSNNRDTFRFEVAEPPSGGGGGGGGGASVSASAVSLKPAKPKAGATVMATVRVTSGGNAVRPQRLTCGGTLGTTRVSGRPRTTAGTASCGYRTTRAAKGKTLRGTIAFTAGGRKLSRRFSVKLG